MQFSTTHIHNKRAVITILVCAFIGLVAMTPMRVEMHRLKKVVIDAGHGGKDPGNLGTGRYKTTEKDITLSVALKLGALIEKNAPDVEIVYTRDKDSFPSLKDRVNIANDSEADLFISVHCDAFTKETANGSGTFVMGMHKTEESLRVAMQENASIFLEEDHQNAYDGFDPKDPDTYIALTLRQNAYLEQSLSLSQKIQSQFKNEVGRVDRGVRQAGYYVICFTTMPSTLIELGFLTNKQEEDYLNSEKGQKEMSEAIFEAFEAYKNEIEGVEVIVDDDSHKSQTTPTPPVVKTNINDRLSCNKKKNDINFEVQILTSTEEIKTGDERFLGVEDISEYKTDDLYKYTAGANTDYEKAKKNQKALRDHGFSGAFIVAIKNGERLDLSEALNQNR